MVGTNTGHGGNGYPRPFVGDRKNSKDASVFVTTWPAGRRNMTNKAEHRLKDPYLLNSILEDHVLGIAAVGPFQNEHPFFLTGPLQGGKPQKIRLERRGPRR
jgi:hypothetical protein